MATTDSPAPFHDIKQQETYILSRDSHESQRLNNQHEFIKQSCDGRVIVAPISEEAIQNVADVGAGTGIWLRDVASQLSTIPTLKGEPRSFHGFDISDAQFPVNPPSNMRFTVQDILQPFPEEERGKYDLVQARFLILALKAKEIETAVRNLTQLLRPGGYLQWIDLEIRLGLHTISPELLPAYRTFLDYLDRNGISGETCTMVKKSAENLGMVNVTYEDHEPAKKKHVVPLLKMAFLTAFDEVLPAVMVSDGKASTMEEAKAIVAEGVGKELREHCDNGAVPDVPIVSVVARAPA